MTIPRFLTLCSILGLLAGMWYGVGMGWSVGSFVSSAFDMGGSYE